MYNAFRVILSELAKRFERLPLLDGWFDRLPLKRNRRFDEQVRPLLRHRGCGCGCGCEVVGGGGGVTGATDACPCCPGPKPSTAPNHR